MLRNLLFLLLLCFSFQACTDEACENIICFNGGYCDDGICDCPDGFTGPTCEEKDDPIALEIIQIEIVEFPELLNDTYNWDNDSAPDLYTQIYLNDNLVTQTNTISNASDEMTHSFLNGLPVFLELDQEYEIDLYDSDEDENLADEWMGGFYFVANDFADNLSDTISLYGSQNNLNINLYVDWVFD